MEYRWDTDTDILTANLRARAVSEGASGSVEIEGSDGSWLILDLTGGVVHGVEVAVWPEVRKRSALAPPDEVTEGRIVFGSSDNGVTSIEMNTALAAEADETERTIHFRVGAMRQAKTVRIARDILDRRRWQRSHRRRVAPQCSPISGSVVITTIVLIKADPKRIPEAAMKLAGIDGVQEVYSVSGEWDLVAIVKVAGVRPDRAGGHGAFS